MATDDVIDSVTRRYMIDITEKADTTRRTATKANRAGRRGL